MLLIPVQDLMTDYSNNTTTVRIDDQRTILGLLTATWVAGECTGAWTAEES